MTAEVLPIRADLAPPTTDFEREAVEVLLAAIRKMREQDGVEPTDLVLVLSGMEGDSTLHHTHSWFCANGEVSKNLAFAATLLAKKVFEP